MLNKKVKVQLLKDTFKKNFFLISIYGKYNYRQYILKKSILYTFFIIINFLYKYGFIIVK